VLKLRPDLRSSRAGEDKKPSDKTKGRVLTAASVTALCIARPAGPRDPTPPRFATTRLTPDLAALIFVSGHGQKPRETEGGARIH